LRDLANVARSVGLASNPTWKRSLNSESVKVDFDRVEIVRHLDLKPHPKAPSELQKKGACAKLRHKGGVRESELT
jgi:hypothetical protein